MCAQEVSQRTPSGIDGSAKTTPLGFERPLTSSSAANISDKRLALSLLALNKDPLVQREMSVTHTIGNLNVVP